MTGKLLISLVLPLFSGNALFSQTKPNVLFIMTDQQAYYMMSCTGNKWLNTPNMDKIATIGNRFDKTYTVNPVCMPSRFSLLTGHYASEVGVKENTNAYKASKVKSVVTDGSLDSEMVAMDISSRETKNFVNDPSFQGEENFIKLNCGESVKTASDTSSSRQ